MNRTQKTYMVARAAYETAVIAHCEEMAKFEEPVTDEDWDAYEVRDAEISQRFNVNELREILREAEEAMLKWAQEKVSKHPAFTSEHAEAFKIVNSNAIARRKLIDLSFRLA